ncbi:MAG: MinD/ParA family protein [Deltaproteobacteria bacterium]|nr:MinD/ParA family protein [Deltaproteobacteria bacterium]
MKNKKPSSNIVSLTDRLLNKNSSRNINGDRNDKPFTRVIAITSGKGGVGKTNIVANLGFSMSRLGRKVLILDADLGLGNLDILLGLAPKYNFSHVITGLKTIDQIIINGPGDMKILPASSGIQELTSLTRGQKTDFISELDSYITSIDVVLIDTAAGISTNVMYFNSIAQEIMVIVSPEPTAITDAYALMKILSLKYLETNFNLIVNCVSNKDEAYDVFRQLKLVADKFLNITIEYVGYVLLDRNITRSVKLQKLVSDIYPDSMGSKCFKYLANKIFNTPPPNIPTGDSSFHIEHFLKHDY